MQVTALLLSLVVFAQGSYREALPGYPYSFPRDHFEHPDFKTEWWYYTGNVWTADGHRFGFELVFFRQGNRIGARDNPSAWRIDDLYFANAALTDIGNKRFYPEERLNRAGPGIAGASFERSKIWNGNWSVFWDGERQTIAVFTDDFTLRLNLTPQKRLVIHGENGVSQKAAGPGHASYYVSFPRLSVAGTISVQSRDYAVSGQAWMDHEWFTHQLDGGQLGWDWFSVQLDNHTELMLYQFRRRDGSRDPFSAGTFIDANGKTLHLRAIDFALKPLETWTSEKTGAKYPVVWKISVASLGLELECRSKLLNQELAVSHGAVYWEGAVDYGGARKGVGYLEMTGYDKPVSLD